MRVQASSVEDLAVWAFVETYYPVYTENPSYKDGKFISAPIRIDEAHATGYWMFDRHGPKMDDEVAFAQGYVNPEQVLRAAEAGMPNTECIQLRWISSSRNRIDDQVARVGTALQHLHWITRRRAQLGLPPLAPGMLPMYPIDVVAHSDNRRRRRPVALRNHTPEAIVIQGSDNESDGNAQSSSDVETAEEADQRKAVQGLEDAMKAQGIYFSSDFEGWPDRLRMDQLQSPLTDQSEFGLFNDTFFTLEDLNFDVQGNEDETFLGSFSEFDFEGIMKGERIVQVPEPPDHMLYVHDMSEIERTSQENDSAVRSSFEETIDEDWARVLTMRAYAMQIQPSYSPAEDSKASAYQQKGFATENLPATMGDIKEDDEQRSLKPRELPVPRTEAVQLQTAPPSPILSYDRASPDSEDSFRGLGPRLGELLKHAQQANSDSRSQPPDGRLTTQSPVPAYGRYPLQQSNEKIYTHSATAEVQDAPFSPNMPYGGTPTKYNLEELDPNLQSPLQLSEQAATDPGPPEVRYADSLRQSNKGVDPKFQELLQQATNAPKDLHTPKSEIKHDYSIQVLSFLDEENQSEQIQQNYASLCVHSDISRQFSTSSFRASRYSDHGMNMMRKNEDVENCRYESIQMNIDDEPFYLSGNPLEDQELGRITDQLVAPYLPTSSTGAFLPTLDLSYCQYELRFPMSEQFAFHENVEHQYLDLPPNDWPHPINLFTTEIACVECGKEDGHAGGCFIGGRIEPWSYSCEELGCAQDCSLRKLA
ncbi:hypothetical protein K432DRAFT_440417 [Lepidopterella palustris CBS 459.81]|uniref:Uncharacterized protein n=1 Tax=Lepidopterella palustris CBS 459.81 TaxID=1314670 RepID=A0A8E2EHD3_9PEZI|nr:hypothetical protein K432DRAFT_440417 [Lepidopterella palustris CBS 459.81]